MTIRPVIALRPVDPPHGSVLTAHLGNGLMTPTADGGWQVVARDRKIGYMDWQGNTPISMEIPIVFDRFAENRSVEPKISRLFQMMVERVGTRNEPVVLKITGVPVPFSGYHWVITNIAPGTGDGDEIRRASDGRRVRAAMTLTVQQYVSGDILLRGMKSSSSSPSKKHKGTTSSQRHKPVKSSTRIYVVKSGDTLSKIAARLLGSSSKYSEIAKLNGIRDPNNIKVGERLKIPAK